MTHTKDEALKMALAAIESEGWCDTEIVITAIKQALAAPVQEPVRGWWAHTSPITGTTDVQDWQLTEGDKARGWIEREIYTTPPAAPELVAAMAQILGDRLAKEQAVYLSMETAKSFVKSMLAAAPEKWSTP